MDRDGVPKRLRLLFCAVLHIEVVGSASTAAMMKKLT
jgi:hypothetical protein